MSVRVNRLFPFRSQQHSTKNSKENSLQKLPAHESLNKNVKPSVFGNPYLKKYNVRKVHHTEESLKKNIYKMEQSKQQKQSSVLQKINGSISLKKNKKIHGIRMHTEKLRNKTNQIKKESPLRRKLPSFQTIDYEEIGNELKYKNLTNLQRQEVHRYEVYYIGKRRINTLKDFTDKNGDARVAAADSIIYRYEIIDILGRGSFGQVFKAYDHKKKEHIALKIIRNEHKFSTQAKVEIKIFQHVLIKDTKSRSNIIELKHGFFFRGHACLVFELLHQNLYEFLKDFHFAGINLDLITRFGIQMLQGLQFLKRYNIIHCDLKPENIMLKQKNKTGIKIIDIGSGCYQEEQIYTYIQSRFYRAPEIILGIPYTCAIDMWSLACVLSELYTGYPIFPGEDESQQMAYFMQILGIPPAEMIEKGCRSKKFFQDFTPKIKPNKKGKLRRPNTKRLKDIFGNCDENFLDFLTKCFQWQPELRLTPSEALLHPWILNGIPQQIRKQHILQARRQSEY